MGKPRETLGNSRNYLKIWSDSWKNHGKKLTMLTLYLQCALSINMSNNCVGALKCHTYGKNILEFGTKLRVFFKPRRQYVEKKDKDLQPKAQKQHL